jgi:hypothetical protein
MNLKFFLSFLLIGFVSACSHKTDSYTFEKINAVKIDESKLVLTRYPSQIEEINDSIVATVNAYQSVSLYNIYSGANLLNFSTKNIQFDSLLLCTFQKKYSDTRKYTYNKYSEGLSGEGGQVKSFQYSNHTFYIHISTMAEVKYLKDSSAVSKKTDTEQVIQLKEKYGDVSLSTMDYINFLFVTDEHFNLEKVIPIYESPKLKVNNYFPIYDRAFYIDKKNIYVYLTKDDEAYETMLSKKQLQERYIAKINTDDENDVHYFLGNDEIDFSGFTIHDYYAAPIKLMQSNNRLVYSNSKEICEVESGKKIFAKYNIAANEWIARFYQDVNDKIILVNYKADKKQHPSEFDEQYALDSLHSASIKVFDKKKLAWVTEKKLPALFHFPFLVSASKVIYFDKDKEHYYFKYIHYNEH